MEELYAQCLLVAEAMDTPAYIVALRQAFADSGAVQMTGLARLNASHVPRELVLDGRNRRLPTTLDVFHAMLCAMGVAVRAEIDRIFGESNRSDRPDKDPINIAAWQPEILIVRKSS